MRVCLVYDCLYPYTVGGAERWFRDLASELVAAGYEVTYVTRRQWSASAPPALPGIRVVAVSPGGPLYTASGRRTIRSPLRFGAGVLLHMLRHRSAYDVVHLDSFPFFSLLAVRLALLGTRTFIAVDWFEVWSSSYWTAYLGRVGGRVGHAVQRLCVRATPAAFVFSRLHAERLRREGVRAEPILLGGLYRRPRSAGGQRGAGEGAGESESERRRETGSPVVVFAGRHIPEKRVPLLVRAMALVRDRHPDCRCVIFGDGPERPLVLRLIAELGLSKVITAPGFVSGEDVQRELASAACLALPSSREGYGLIVIEAAAVGTPSVVIRDPDNAAVELVEPGVNGVVCEQATPQALGESIGAVLAERYRMAASTAAWFEDHVDELSIDHSLAQVLAVYPSSARR